MIKLYFISFCIKERIIGRNQPSSYILTGANLRYNLYAYNEEKNLGVEIVMEQIHYYDITNLKRRSTFFNPSKRITKNIILDLLSEANFRMIGGTGIVSREEIKKIVECLGGRKDKLYQFIEIPEEKLEGILNYNMWSSKLHRKKLLKGIREIFTPKNFTAG